MSWGERSCGQGHPCGYECTILTCNVNCKGYRWDGFTKQDSIKEEHNNIIKALHAIKEMHKREGY